jgi:hypothetical protein
MSPTVKRAPRPSTEPYVDTAAFGVVVGAVDEAADGLADVEALSNAVRSESSVKDAETPVELVQASGLLPVPSTKLTAAH